MSDDYQFEPSEQSHYAGLRDDVKAAAQAKIDAAKAAVGAQVDAAGRAIDDVGRLVSGAQNRGAQLAHDTKEKADTVAGVLGWIPWILGGLAALTIAGLAAWLRPSTTTERVPNPAQDRSVGSGGSALVLSGRPVTYRRIARRRR